MIARYCSKAIVAVAVLALFGCAEPVVYQPVPGPAGPAAAPAPVDAEAETDLVPPVPTFTSIADCELAYGPGACGSGEVIYGQASLPPPPDAGTWYMPFAFGVMTGVLVNRYYAPPTVYFREVQYSQFIAPVVIQKYRVVTPATVRFYHSVPLVHRQSVLRSGPVRYAPRRGEFVGNPYGHGFTRPATSSQRQLPGTSAPGRQPAPIGQRPGVRPPGPISEPQKPPFSKPTTRSVAGPGTSRPTGATPTTRSVAGPGTSRPIGATPTTRSVAGPGTSRPTGTAPTTRAVAGPGTSRPTTGGTTPMTGRTTTHKPPSASMQAQKSAPPAPRPVAKPEPAPKKAAPKKGHDEKGQAGR